MRIDVKVEVNTKFKESQDLMTRAARIGMRRAIVLMANAAIKGSPWKTGNNRRSIAYEASGFGSAQFLEATGPELVVNPNAIEGAIYSTSGYGGYLETGTRYMQAQPYIIPAFEQYKDKIAQYTKEALE